MKTKTLTFDTSFKAVEGDEPGTFQAVVACFNNVDRAGEVITPGAFKASLEDGLPPVIFSHQWMTPPIGVTLSATETKEGLLVKGRLFVDDDSVPLAKHVYKAMSTKGGDGRPALREWSVGLRVKSERFEERDGQKVTVLDELDLLEFGPCLKGVNPNTRTVAVKAEQDLAELVAKSTETSSDGESETQRIAESDAPAPTGALTPENKRKVIDVLL